MTRRTLVAVRATRHILSSNYLIISDFSRWLLRAWVCSIRACAQRRLCHSRRQGSRLVNLFSWDKSGRICFSLGGWRLESVGTGPNPDWELATCGRGSGKWRTSRKLNAEGEETSTEETPERKIGVLCSWTSSTIKWVRWKVLLCYCKPVGVFGFFFDYVSELVRSFSQGQFYLSEVDFFFFRT